MAIFPASVTIGQDCEAVLCVTGLPGGVTLDSVTIDPPGGGTGVINALCYTFNSDVAATGTIDLTFNFSDASTQAATVLIEADYICDPEWNAVVPMTVEIGAIALTQDPDPLVCGEDLQICGTGSILGRYNFYDDTPPVDDAPWYLAAGIEPANCLAAYQPFNAADYADSKVNIHNPGVYNATDGVLKPAWDPGYGWVMRTYAPSAIPLLTGIVPVDNQSYSMVGWFENEAGDAAVSHVVMGGRNNPTSSELALYANYQNGGLDYVHRFRSGGQSREINPKINPTSGVMGIAGRVPYFNGIPYPSVPSGSGSSPREIYLNGLNAEGTGTHVLQGHLKAAAIYDTILTPLQMAAMYAKLMALRLTPAPVGGWWDDNGAIGGCVAAYAPKGAASYAASKINLANPGTYNATDGAAPSWGAGTGWTFNGTSHYLRTGVVPSPHPFQWTFIIKFANVANTGYLMSTTQGITAGHGFSPRRVLNTNASYWTGISSARSPHLATGTMGMIGFQPVRNGAFDGAETTPNYGSITTRDYFIGADNNQGTAGFFCSGDVSSAVIFRTRLTLAQYQTVEAAMP